eukprot:4955337-Pleurochrysis_carterae.AAC.1
MPPPLRTGAHKVAATATGFALESACGASRARPPSPSLGARLPQCTSLCSVLSSDEFALSPTPEPTFSPPS